MSAANTGKKPFIDRFNGWTMVTLVLLILILIFIVYPFSNLLLSSVSEEEGGGYTFQHYAKFFASRYHRQSLINSFKVSFGATALSVLIGLPMAYFTSRYFLRGKRLIDNLCIIAMLSPPFIGAYSWILLLGRNGFITRGIRELTGFQLPSIYGFSGIMLVFTLKLFPFVYLYVSGALRSMDASLEEAAESLGMSGFRKLTTITFPLILPTILSSALMVFMTSLADFGTPALIGEGFRVLPVSIYNEYLNEMGGNAAFASALSVVMIMVAMIVLILQKKAISGRSYHMSGLREPKRKCFGPISGILAHIFVYAVAIMAILPQITVAVTSFIKTKGPVFQSGFGLNSYTEAFSKMGVAIRNSFIFSIAAIIIMILGALLLSYLVVRRSSKLTNFIDMLAMFPYIIPGAVIGIMLANAFNSPPLMLSGTASILVISYVIRKLPFTLRSSVGILYQIESSVEEASISLGVPPMRTFFKITARLMLPGVVSGAILSWIASINELSSTMILFTGRTQTISVAIFTEVTSTARFGTAAALATILTVVTIGSLWLANRLSGGKISITG